MAGWKACVLGKKNVSWQRETYLVLKVILELEVLPSGKSTSVFKVLGSHSSITEIKCKSFY